MTSGIEFIPVTGMPDGMMSVGSAIANLNTRFPESKLSKRQGPGGKQLTYVPWDESLRVLNGMFGQVYWGEDNTNESYDSTSRTYRLTKRIWIAVYDPAASLIVVFSRAGQGRSVARDDSESAHDLAASAVESDAFSKAVKKLGDAFAAYLYDHADPARQENPTSAGRTYPAQRTSTAQPSHTQESQGGGSWQNQAPTEPMINALRRNKVPADVIARVNKKQAGDMIGTFKAGGDLNTALGVAGLLQPAGVVEDHYLDSRQEEAEEIPF